jgi:hypothetical protein
LVVEKDEQYRDEARIGKISGHEVFCKEVIKS